MSDSVRPHGQQPTRLLCPWESLGKNTGVGCHFLLQLVMASQPQVGNWGDIPSCCQNHLFWGSSLFLPCLALVANLRFSLVEWKLAFGTRWHTPKPGRSTGVRMGTFPFVSTNAVWAFLPIGSDGRWGLFVSTDCYLDFFANCFWCLSAFEDRFEAWSTIWAFLPIDSDIWLLLRTVYVGEVFVWDFVPVTFKECL